MQTLNTAWKQQKKLSGSFDSVKAVNKKHGSTFNEVDHPVISNKTNKEINDQSHISDDDGSFLDTIGPDVLLYVDSVEQKIKTDTMPTETSNSPGSKRIHNGEIILKAVLPISVMPVASASKTAVSKRALTAKSQFQILKKRRSSKQLLVVPRSASEIVDHDCSKQPSHSSTNELDDGLYEPKKKLFRPSETENQEKLDNSADSDSNSSRSSVWGDSLDKHLLSNWSLPKCVLHRYAEVGITSMFPWQVECLTLGSVLRGGNLVYSAPTSAGKTLVAEILVLKRVLDTKRKAIVILPFVSVAREKMFYLKRMFRDAGIRVDGYMGTHYPPGGWKAVDVAVCTIERANGLFNRLMEEKKINQVGVLVVDELHMLGDSGRGYLLELLLTKVRYLTWKFSNEKNVASVQIIGMSATLPNLDLLATWLQADLYKTDFRPVPLFEHVKIGNTIYDTTFKVIRHLKSNPELDATDPDQVIQLCLETITDGHAVLIFCPTKGWCESLAKSIAAQIFNLGKISDRSDKPASGYAARNGERLRQIFDPQNLMDVLSQLRNIPSGLDKMLHNTIQYGVAFHHAGLTFDERDIIEAAFRGGTLKVLVATSTLSSGVNLPARRVIIRSPMFLRQLIDVLSYRQMIGRAGRKGIDTEGESILICKENEKSKAMTLVQSELRPIQSSLIHRFKDSLSNSMKRAVLEVVVSGVASSPEEVEHYCNCTLLAASLKEASKESGQPNGHANAVQVCINFLVQNEFIVRHIMETSDGSEKVKYVPTPLGNAVMASSISPDEGLIIFQELNKARKEFVLENELHIVYQVTPLHVADQWPELDWKHYHTMWYQLPEHQKTVARLVGVKEHFLVRLACMPRTAMTSDQYRTLARHQRFYTAMALHDLVNEVPLNVVADRYGCSRGMLQSLQQSASTFAGMVTAFCNRLGWSNMELLLAQFQKRLNFGIQRELCELVRLPLLNGQRARILYNGGIRDVNELAHSSVLEVEVLLRNAGPFVSEKQCEDETAYEFQERRQARCIWLTGNKGLTEAEAAKVLIDDARELVQKDLGISIQWEDSVSQVHAKEEDIFPPIHIKGSQIENMVVSDATKEELQTAQESFVEDHKLNNDKHVSLDDHEILDSNISVHNNDVQVAFEGSHGDSTLHGVLCVPFTKSKDNSECCTLKSQVNFVNVKPSENSGNVAEENKLEDEHAVQYDNIMNCVSDVTFLNEFTKDLQTTTKEATLDTKTSDVVSASFLEGFSQDELFMNASSTVVLTEQKCNTTPVAGCIQPLKALTPTNFSESFILDSQTTHLVDGQHARPLSSAGLIVNQVGSPANSSRELFDGVLESPVANVIDINATSTPFLKSLQSKLPTVVSPRFEDSLVSHYMANYASQVGNQENVLPMCSDARTMVNEELLLDVDADLFASPKIKDAGVHALKPSDIPVKPNADSEPGNNFKEILFGDYSRASVGPNSDDDDDDDNMGSLQLEDTSNDSMLEANKSGKVETAEIKCETDFASKQTCTKLHTFKRVLELEVQNLNNKEIAAPAYINEQPTTSLSDPFMKRHPCSENMVKYCMKQVDSPKLDGDCHKFHLAESKALDINVGYTVRNILDRAIDSDNSIPSKPPPKRKTQFEGMCLQQPDLPAVPSKVTSKTYITSAPSISISKSSLNHQEINHNRRSNEFVPPTPVTERFSVSINGIHSKSLTLKQIRNAPLGNRPSKSFNCRLDKKLRIPTACSYTEPIVDSDSSFKSTDNELDESHISDYESDTDSPVLASVNTTHSLQNKKYSQSSIVSEDKTSFLDSFDESFHIIDVAADKNIFLTFVNEWKAKAKFSMCLACVRTSASAKPCVIGQKIKKVQCDRSNTPKELSFIVEDRLLAVVGVAVCWENRDAYYLPLQDNASSNSGLNEGSSPLSLDTNLSVADRLEAVKSVLHLRPSSSAPTIVAYDFKEQMRMLYNGCEILCYCPGEDPKVGYWLLEPTEPANSNDRIYSLKHLVSLYCPHNSHMIEDLGGRIPIKSLGLAVDHPKSPRIKAATEAVLVLHLMNSLQETLTNQNLYSVFKEVEMKAVQVLLKTELTGIGISGAECQSQLTFVEKRLQELEYQAFQLAGHRFSLTSQASVAQVLYVELALPPDAEAVSSKSTVGAKRWAGLGDKKRISKVTKRHSTNKKVLEKLQKLHPLPGVILEWRKLSSAYHKVLMPLVKELRYAPFLNMERIYGTCLFFTATGRMSMSNPNLQSVPRDFELSCAVNHLPTAHRVSKKNEVPTTSTDNPAMTFRVRDAFIPCAGFKLLSADYSQLELRLLAHLCQDATLVCILNSGGDVFKSIAAKWKGIKVELVTTEQRQQAKQICYGMVYGIGERALGDQLGVKEDDAAEFMKSFKSSYPGIQTYILNVVEQCRRDGYVTTVMGRHRYLPNINSENSARRGKAERQAVNTTIQGSAADLIKKAMIAIDTALCGSSFGIDDAKNKERSKCRGSRDIYMCGARLVLQLHDELIYEVREDLLPRVARIVRKEMEGALRLSVELPVNIKVGPSWSGLHAYEYK